jgi:hypothetical protein
MRDGFAIEACFPPAEDLPENLTVAEFRRSYGGVGSRTYRNAVARIDAFLARCAALAADPVSRKR